MTASPLRPPPVTVRSPRVVVIDDDELQRELMIDVLQRAGYETTGLPSMIGVTNHIVRHEIDVVVIDVLMPTIRGDKLATLLRKNPALGRLGVVLVSSMPPHEVAPLLSSIEVDGFVSKAEVRSALPSAVARASNRYSSQRQEA